jgi:4-amino-4-deoxy-L-arabinose transferase-like glycosyltransferase
MISLMEKLPTPKIILMIILLFVPLFLFYLGTPSLWDEDESVYAEISRQMILRHDLVGTYFNYEPRFDKPPLNFWINVLFYKTFGMNEFTSRIGSNIFGFLCLILVYFFGKKLFNKKTGIIASLMLGTGLLFFIETHMALIDTALTFFIGLTLYFFYRYLSENKPQFLMLMGFPLGLGILAKGPVALIITGAIGLFFWLFLYFQKMNQPSLWNWHILGGFMLALAICLPWYWAMWSRYGMNFIQSHFGYHMFERFTQPIESHGGGWYYNLYYVVLLFLGFMPWSACIPSSLKLALKRRSESSFFFILTWSVIIFAFFTIAQTKLPGYALPLFPPIAILMAHWWEQLLSGSSPQTNPWWGFIIELFIVVAVVALIALNRKALPQEYQNLVWVLFILPLSLIIGFFLIWFWKRKNKGYEPFFTITFFTYYLLWVLFILFLVPIAEKGKPVKYLADELKPYLTQRDQVIDTIEGSFSSPFYTRHPVLIMRDKTKLNLYFQHNRRTRVFAFINIKSLEYLRQHHLQYYLFSHFGSGYLIANQPVEKSRP